MLVKPDCSQTKPSVFNMIWWFLFEIARRKNSELINIFIFDSSLTYVTKSLINVKVVMFFCPFLPQCSRYIYESWHIASVWVVTVKFDFCLGWPIFNFYNCNSLFTFKTYCYFDIYRTFIREKFTNISPKGTEPLKWHPNTIRVTL